jgi:hypothetical protein
MFVENRRRVGLMRQMLDSYDYSEEIIEDEDIVDKSSCPKESVMHLHSRYDDEEDLFVVLDSSNAADLSNLSNFHLQTSKQLLNFHILLPSHKRLLSKTDLSCQSCMQP